MSIDPRFHHVRRFFRGIERVYGVVSSKGGVGKTTIACLLGLLLSRRGYSVGMIDLDFTNTTLHVVLGVEVEKSAIEEGYGVKPILVDGIKLATPVLFTRGHPIALRGDSIVDALRELLVAFEWGDLNVLILDMPPGVKDELLEALSLGVKPIVVSSQDALSIASVRRLLRFLKDEGVARAWVVENMSKIGMPLLLDEVKTLGYEHLGVLPYDDSVSLSIGNPGRLLETKPARVLSERVEELLV